MRQPNLPDPAASGITLFHFFGNFEEFIITKNDGYYVRSEGELGKVSSSTCFVVVDDIVVTIAFKQYDNNPTTDAIGNTPITAELLLNTSTCSALEHNIINYANIISTVIAQYNVENAILDGYESHFKNYISECIKASQKLLSSL